MAPAAPVSSILPQTPTPNIFKEFFTMDTPNFDFAAAFKTAFSDAQEKAKAAYEKSTVALGDANEFAKGNVEALVESSKILASGLQELTTGLVAESREAFETLTAEVKTMAAVKSPADFFRLQSEMMRKQMDTLIANGSKHSEAFMKLANDAAAPISSRVNMAVEKVKTAA
jgi:phasin family protein